MSALAHATGLEIDAYRREHVEGRILRALERERVPTVAALASRLREDAQARRRFRRAVAMPVTALFRDPAQFALLEDEILPALLQGGGRLSVWSAGCADGPELASVALLLQRLGALDRALLLGTDLLRENIDAARAADHVPGARLRWQQRDLLRDGPPAGRWKLVLCRNVCIYLTRDAKTAVHRQLTDALAPGGVLLLGRSERLSDPRALGVVPVAPHAYRKLA
jgi:chemotaxis protein methyltransferase CheR